MPKGFSKVIMLICGIVGLTGCLSHFINPLTFTPLLVLSRLIYINEGIVSNGVLVAWHVFTWITYIQLLTMFLQFGAFYIIQEVDKQEKRPHYRLNLSKVELLVSIFFHILIVALITWLHFPAVRGSAPYPGAHLQWILGIPMLFLGLFIWLGMSGVTLGTKNRPSYPRHRPSRSPYDLSRIFLPNRNKPMPTPRGRTPDGTILPKPTHPPQRRLPPTRRFGGAANKPFSASTPPLGSSRFGKSLDKKDNHENEEPSAED